MPAPEVHLIAGTRPEAVKLAPVAMRMREQGRLDPLLVASGQHPSMATQALAAFDMAGWPRHRSHHNLCHRRRHLWCSRCHQPHIRAN